MKSFRSKMICILLAMSLIPLVMAVIYSYRISSRNLYEKMNQTEVAFVESMAHVVDNELQRLTVNIDMAISQREFQHAVNQLGTASSDGTRWRAMQDMNKVVGGIFGRGDAVSGIYVIAQNGYTCAVMDEYHLNLDRFMEEDPCFIENMGLGAVVAEGIRSMGDGREAMMFGKLIKDVADKGNLAEIGVAHFAVDPVKFSSVIAQNEEDSAFFLLNQEGQIVTARCEAQEQDLYHRMIQEQQKEMREKKGIIPVSLGTESLVMIYSISPVYQYQVIRCTPYSVYNSEVENIIWMLVLFSLVYAVSAVLVSAFVSKSISRPIQELSRAMGYTEKGDFAVRLESGRRDEMGNMMRSFNHMVEQLDSLFTQTIEDEKAKKNLEICSLQYQISPHFLYNLLASVRSLAVIEGAEETGEMLGDVSRLLRNTVSYAGMLVPLSFELENIQTFLSIQNACHSGLISQQIQVQEGIQDLLVPNLILQPIVENAVFHGADPESGEVWVEVSAKKQGEVLLLTVRDHGCGISREEQRKILEGQARGELISHVGLRNTKDRIRLNFGSPYDLLIDSEGAGTRIRLFLPILHRNHETTEI